MAIEYLGFIPLLLIVALLAIQLGLAAYAANQAGTAARVAARVASQDQQDQKQSPESAGQNAVSGWLHPAISGGAGGDSATYTATIKVPTLVPGVDWGTARRSSTMPMPGN
ncbi:MULTISPECIES: TadE/TadG family type IV pilus assembly protein [unclassified Streptomyces]|uniref:TadE/TadG family type IV pilus assembly protein n=1 Tax=unclassified Streptomyces TaxID=2593676 RepID=UPI0005A86F8F|nr:TadE/TadG family type IV pilus assembly protein [Streptomyces sp. NBC_00370]